MQSPTILNSEPNPVATATTEQLRDPESKAQPTQSEPDVQDEENNSTAPVETETAITSQENGTRLQTAETPESMEVTQAVENEPAVQPPTEPSDNTEGIGTDADPKPSAPTESAPDPITNPACDGQKAKKQDKTVTDGRKYVPSKKAMVDPLKMDMSKQMVIPFPSSQLSLQCLECHIIFSDHKSKERHLKLSHPAEYEQCILRNALFACYVCDRQFTNSTELMVHQKAHTEKKPFKCPICSQAFKKSSELTFHKKIHFGKDGYACTDCGKPCKTMTLLKYHRRTHTGERPYVCKECGKRFTMSKALQKHMLAHSPEGAEGDGGDNAAKEQLKKDCGGSTKYPCSVCKATFKSTKTRLHHMKTKHNATSNALPFVKQGTPIITPITFCQPTLLTVEPNGPLQKVDGNIDTEQIRRLIESLGNVQKVNQVVILGQVPPHATPLEVQQISQLAANYNVNPLQIDLMGQEHTESEKDDLDPLNNPCVSMEHTIILEPITPDGHLETPYFSELGSHIPAESIELTLVPTEQPERPEGDQAPQQHHLSTIQSDPMDQMVCQNEVVDFKENLEQTVILELTPALTPTVELEQYQTVPQNEIPTSSLVIEMEPNSDQTVDQIVIDDQETNQSVPPPMHTVELEQTHLQREQQDPPSSPCIPPGTLTHTQIESESSPKEDFDSHIQTICLKQVHPVKDKHTPQRKQDKAEHEPSEKVQANRKKGQNKKENLSGIHDPTTKGDCSSQLEAKQVPQMSGLPINVMSAQELVKVRKRKPARAFIFQGLQELVGSLHKDDFQIDAEPAKRQKKKKSHLVVKFGPQNKEKKHRKQKKPSQHCQPTQEELIKSKTPNKNLSKKKGPLQKERKGKKDEQAAHLVSTAKIKSPSSTQNPQVQQIKEDTRKKKIKNQKIVVREDVIHTSEHKSIASPVFKKKKQAKIMQKDQPKNKKDGKLKKNLTRKEKVKNKTSTASADILGPHIVQDSLLLLKGHKQPQLKVYKLDPSTASSQPQEDTTLESQTISDTKHPTSESTNNLRTEGKKKRGRLQKNPKALSLLPSLQVSHQPTETMLTKPKTSRKRKSSSKVETEGVITSSHSKRALECKDCGERFSEVSSLQKHKATVHIAESPGLTYTNGNIFEGVSRLDLFQLPKQNDEVVGTMSAVADWDTEPEIVEMALEDRDRKLSFPALIPSPSLPVPPSDFEMSAYENNGGSKIFAEDLSPTPAAVHSPSDQTKNCESPINFTSDSPFSIAIQTKSSETAESLESAEEKQKEQNPKDPRSESEVQVTTDEDIKEDFLLEVDLVTVGEQNERDDTTYHEDTGAQNESNSNCNSEGKSSGKYPGKASHETTEKSLSSQTVSCSTHQEEIKEEEEEMLVQKKKVEKGAVAKNATRGRKRGTGHLKRDVISKRVSVGDTATGTESEKDQDECQVVYEKHPVTLDSEMIDESETGAKTSKAQTSSDIEATQSTAPPMPLPSISSILEESHEEQVVFELESVSTSVEEETNGGLQGGECDRDKSPAIILEKFLTSRPRATGDKELCLMKARNNQQQGLDSIAESEVQVLWSREIKVEENISDPPLIAPICQNRQRVSLQPQHHRDIRTVLVKEESSFVLHEAQTTQGSRHIRWNVEQVNIENTSSPLMESEEATMDCSITPEFNTSQCIFYPVKEEEREVDLGAAQTNSEALTTGPSSDAQQMELQATDSHFTGEVSHSAPEYQEIGVRGLLTEPGFSDFADGHAEADAEPPADLRDFLLQSSDEEDVGAFELSEPQLDSEAEVMAAFYKNPTNSARQPDENLPTSTSQFQAPREDSKTSKEPIDFFCQYFGWDTWVDIANCTNTLSNMPNPVTAKEVAQFVGIHVAMGTLKFPSSRLYWENLTKVPLVAEAMPLSRFLQLSRMLKLASPAKDPAGSSVWEESDSADFHNVQQGEKISNRQSKIPPCRDVQKQGDAPDDASSSKTQTDPLWKAEPLLCRFKAGCQSLRRDSDYAVDQYPLPLTGKMHNKKMSLHCTTLIGFGGLLLHVDLKSGLSGKEDAVEKMVPKGSMVFLCKQELSTPAMLERLLAAGVHGAGRVGGARGQIGDEFVSSDGKLMLRRSHCGFILSTAGNGQRNMASLIDHFEKAQRSAHLNRDLQKLYSIPLTASAPTCWPQAVLWYLTDLALVNSWLLYRQNQRAASTPLTLMAFRLEVSKALILSSGSDTQDSVPPQPPMEKAHSSNETPSPSLLEVSPLPDAATRYDASGHWPEQLGEGEGGRCRYGDCQRTSRVLCLKCCVFLCISRNHNCFLNFHNQGNLGKK